MPPTSNSIPEITVTESAALPPVPVPVPEATPPPQPDIARAAEDLVAPAARRASHTESMLRAAGGIATKAVDLQEKAMAMSEYLGMAEVVSGFLGDLAQTVPFGATIAKCFSIMYQAELVAQDNEDKATTLFKRVTFVLDTVRNLYQIGKWNVDSAQSVLGTIELSVVECAKYFHKFRAKSAFQRRFYSTKIRERFAGLDAGLSAALAQLQLVLQVETVLRLEPTPTFTKPSPEDAKAEKFIESHGGADAFRDNPDLVEQLAKAIGVEYSATLVGEVGQRFDAVEASLEAGFLAAMQALEVQGQVLDNIHHNVSGLAQRGAAYEDLYNEVIRGIWQRCGWGATVPLVNFIEVIVAETKDGYGVWAEEHGFDIEYYVLEGFRKHLKRLDADQSGLVTVREVNDFFFFDFSLIQWALVGTFYMRQLEIDLLHEVAVLCRQVRDHIRALPDDAAFVVLFKAVEPELLTLAHLCERSTEDELADITPETHAAIMEYIRADMFEATRTGLYDGQPDLYDFHVQQLIAVQSPGVHRHFSASIKSELSALLEYMSELRAADRAGEDEHAPMLSALTSCLYEIARTFERAFPDTILQLDAKAKQAAIQYGYLATRGSTDWSALFDFPPTTLQEPFPLTAWVPSALSPDVPENAVVGGTLFGAPVYLVQALVNVAGRTNLVPSFAYRSPTGHWKCKAAIAGVQHAATFQWLTRARNVHVASTVNEPADHILAWVPLRLDGDAPHPLAGRAGIEYRKHETYFARLRVDPATVVPGKLFTKNGQMHASFVLPRADGDGAYEYTTLPHQSKSSLRRPLSRDIAIEILIADSRNIAFYQHLQWNTLAEARARNAQPVIAGGTSDQPAYLAWTVGDHGMRLGMVFADEDYALLGEDPFGGGRDDDNRDDDGLATPHFRVLTGLPGAVFESGPYRPHPHLAWKKTTAEGIVHGAHSAMKIVIVNQTLRGETLAVARTVSTKALADKPHLGRRVMCVGEWSWAKGKNEYDLSGFEIPFIPPVLDDGSLDEYETLHFDVAAFHRQYADEGEGTDRVRYMADADGNRMVNHTYRQLES
ncbi:hypothetical protein H9P43_006415 [Blastocladiella emersonii ATCC 22665]|nr:hypothetical protein H9P43_006415 [Blastocladiella emersonii ATCC 22665]